MKNGFFILLLLMATGSSFAYKSSPYMAYRVVSSTYDASLDSGICIVTGTVRLSHGNETVRDVRIGQEKKGELVKSGADGKFECTVVAGKALFFYKGDYTEVTVPAGEFKSQHRIVVEVYLRTGGNTMVRKPVIYLYSEDDVMAEIKLYPRGDFTFTYPPYADGWLVNVLPDGGLKCQGDERVYPYLFWEGSSPDLFYSVKDNKLPGFIVQRDTAAQFLDRALTMLGLNATEKTDFITYWGPVVVKSEYALLQFIVDEEYHEKIAELNMKPEADSYRRVFLLCSNLNDTNIGMDVIPQTFNTFEREGLTLIEWGGSEIDLSNIKP